MSLKRSETVRANGAKSHGPKTEAGKRRSSRNALKHGLYARDLILSVEGQNDFTALRGAYLAELEPQGALQLDLVEQMVMARWRLARLWRIETAMLESAMDRNEKQIREDWERPNNSLRLALAFDMLAREDGALTQLNRQEARLSRQFERAARELRLRVPTSPQPPPPSPLSPALGLGAEPQAGEPAAHAPAAAGPEGVPPVSFPEKRTQEVLDSKGEGATQLMLDIDRNRALALGVTPQQVQNAAQPGCAVETLHPFFQRGAGAARCGDARPANRRPAEHQPPRPVARQGAQQVDDAIRELWMPATISTSFQGTVKEFQRSFQNLYESFIHPITILSGLPSAVFGALVTLLIFGKQIDLYALVGLIMLFGVVKKSAIMMIDFAMAAQREGKSPREAIWQGCLLRFRPIMMTTVAALFGTLPIALGYGEGADARRPLGLAAVGGLVVSQFLTLYITPVIYLYPGALAGRVTPQTGADVRAPAGLHRGGLKSFSWRTSTEPRP